MATVIPSLKSSKKTLLLDNYHPVSLTPVLCEVLERIINKRLMWKLETNSCLNTHQCRFRAEKSTQDQLLYFQNNIHGSFSAGRHLLAIFFDYSNAFDITWRYKILKVLQDLGFRGRLPTFIQNFLHLRFCMIRLG